jgi:sugar phosphate isomerase/epimerase
MKMLLCVQTPEVPSRSPISLLSGTFEEMLVKASAWGADGLELMPVNPLRLDIGWIRSLLDAHHLREVSIGSALLSIVSGLTLLNADAEKSAQAKTRLSEMIDFAAKLSANPITIGGFRGRFSSVGEQGWLKLAEILSEAADYAEARGIRLALEPVNRYQLDGIANVEEGLAFIAEVGSPALGLTLDTCHMNMEESSWSEPFQRAMAMDRLWHIHLADNNRLAPGRGLIDFRSILGTLKSMGYDRYVSFEILARPDPDGAAKDSLSYIRSLLEKP